MRNRKIVVSVGKPTGKFGSMSAPAQPPLWIKVRFASPPGWKENKI